MKKCKPSGKKLVSVIELADKLGVSKQTIYGYIARGIVIKKGMKIELEPALRSIEKSIDHTHHKAKSKTDISSEIDSQEELPLGEESKSQWTIRKEKALCELKEHELKVLKGTLVNHAEHDAEIEKQLVKLFNQINSQIKELPNKYFNECFACKSKAEVKAVLEDAVRGLGVSLKNIKI